MDSAPDAGCVDEAPLLATELHELVDGVNRRASNGVDDRAVLTGEAVQQAGLADIGASKQCHATGAAADRRRILFWWKRVDERVEQVAGPAAMQR